MLGAKYPAIREALRKFRTEQTERVLANPDPAAGQGASFRLGAPAPPAKRKPA
jgi:CTP:molybdopterin cytidylyltransferase MocA